MNQLIEYLSRIFSSWRFWIVVPPWDVGVRVRLGKNAVALPPGLHWRIPFLDEISLVNTRLRIETTPPVCLPGTRPGHCRIAAATVCYRITDPLRAVLAFNQPGIALLALAQAVLAKNFDEATALEQVIIAAKGTGIDVERLYFVENTLEVRAFRLFQQYGGLYSTSAPIPVQPGATVGY